MNDKVPCPLCHRDMSSPTTVSCLRRKGITFADGSVYAAIPYSSDPHYPLEREDDQCRDCGVMWDGTHHLYCCIETCPKCYGQMLSCETCHPTVIGALTPTQWRLYLQRQRATPTVQHLFQSLQGMELHRIKGKPTRQTIENLLLIHPSVHA